MTNTTIKIRPYSKTELAMLYFPSKEPVLARKKLMRALSRCRDLSDRLASTGYKTTDKMLSPRQVGMIFDLFGEP